MHHYTHARRKTARTAHGKRSTLCGAGGRQTGKTARYRQLGRTNWPSGALTASSGPSAQSAALVRPESRAPQPPTLSAASSQPNRNAIARPGVDPE